MSGPADSNPNTAKIQEPKTSDPGLVAQADKQSQQPPMLEEDDEFEDFPVEDWTQEEAEVPGGNTHLWEESWDDDENNEEFSKQLKEELKKVEASKS